MAKIKFYQLKNTTYWRKGIKALPYNVEFPCVVLVTNGWDDFGYKTTFDFVYVGEDGQLAIELQRDIKILQMRKDKTQISDEFEKLDKSYCSLGQSLEYYEKLLTLGRDIYEDIFLSLRDIVHEPKFATPFKTRDIFRSSLLRFSTAEKAYKEAGSLYSRRPVEIQKNLKFQFSTQVQGAEDSHVIDFDFNKDKTDLFRINAIIGKNGTGKTQVLANLATGLSGLTRANRIFEPDRPSISNVISISYSVFDEFARPSDYYDRKLKRLNKKKSGYELKINQFVAGKKTNDREVKKSKKANERRKMYELRLKNTINEIENTHAQIKLFSYIYCGIRRRQTELLTPSEIHSKLGAAIEKIRVDKRQDEWIEIIDILLDESVNIDELTQVSVDGIDKPFYDKLSSGQRILLLVISEVIAHIQKDSMILFDEPELHLHPEAISALTRALHKLLYEFDSYCIIATHSPIILQEIPAKYVRIFRRNGLFPIVDPLRVESFGESISAITDEVFETREKNNNFLEHFKDMLKKQSLEEILQMFDTLGFNARASLYALDANELDE